MLWFFSFEKSPQTRWWRKCLDLPENDQDVTGLILSLTCTEQMIQHSARILYNLEW